MTFRQFQCNLHSRFDCPICYTRPNIPEAHRSPAQPDVGLVARLRQRVKPLRQRMQENLGRDLHDSYDTLLTEAINAIEEQGRMLREAYPFLRDNCTDMDLMARIDAFLKATP